MHLWLAWKSLGTVELRQLRNQCVFDGILYGVTLNKFWMVGTEDLELLLDEPLLLKALTFSFGKDLFRFGTLLVLVNCELGLS